MNEVSVEKNEGDGSAVLVSQHEPDGAGDTVTTGHLVWLRNP